MGSKGTNSHHTLFEKSRGRRPPVVWKTFTHQSHHGLGGYNKLINGLRAAASGAFVCWRPSLLFTCQTWHVNRDLTIRQRRRQSKCSWKRRNRVRVQRERESKIYRLAVSVLKSTPNLVISPRSCAGTAKKCTKRCDARAELLFNLLIKPIVFRRSRCRLRRSFVRSLIYILRARLLSCHSWLLLPSS